MKLTALIAEEVMNGRMMIVLVPMAIGYVIGHSVHVLYTRIKNKL